MRGRVDVRMRASCERSDARDSVYADAARSLRREYGGCSNSSLRQLTTKRRIGTKGNGWNEDLEDIERSLETGMRWQHSRPKDDKISNEGKNEEQ